MPLAWRDALALAALIWLGACSSGAPTEGDQRQQAEQPDPPGAAQALSLGDDGALEGMSDFNHAVKCAAALKATLTVLNGLTTTAGTEELRTLKSVEQRFRQRAMAIGEAEGHSRSSVTSGIERQVLLGSTSEQARLAMACLRSLPSETT